MFFDYPADEEYSSADQRLWYGLARDILTRFKSAKKIIKHEENYNIGERANALHVLSTYYRNGWFVTQDIRLADEYLKASADLGHTKACYDYAIILLKDGNTAEALAYIDKGLAEINNEIFDSELTGHHQKSLADLLAGLKIRCENNHINLSNRHPILTV